jgi:putative N6-adenine-specific DNA methylase
MEFKLCIPCLFGLEGLVADELRQMGLGPVQAENGRVLFQGDEHDIAAVNIGLRTGERLLLLLGEFPALSFDDLFEGVKALPWNEILPKDAAFPVKGHCLNSKLHSVPDCQKIIKKAAADKLSAKHGPGRLPETGAVYQIRFSNLQGHRDDLIRTPAWRGFTSGGYRPNMSMRRCGKRWLRRSLKSAVQRTRQLRRSVLRLGTIAIELLLRLWAELRV